MGRDPRRVQNPKFQPANWGFILTTLLKRSVNQIALGFTILKFNDSRKNENHANRILQRRPQTKTCQQNLNLKILKSHFRRKSLPDNSYILIHHLPIFSEIPKKSKKFASKITNPKIRNFSTSLSSAIFTDWKYTYT